MRNTSIAENIAAGRRELGITQAALAERMGVTKAAVSKWELGQSLPLVWGRRRKKIGQNRSHDPAPQTRGFLTGSIIPGLSVLSLTQVSPVSYSE